MPGSGHRGDMRGAYASASVLSTTKDHIVSLLPAAHWMRAWTVYSPSGRLDGIVPMIVSPSTEEVTVTSDTVISEYDTSAGMRLVHTVARTLAGVYENTCSGDGNSGTTLG